MSFLVPDWITKETESSLTVDALQRTKDLKQAFALLGINPAAQVIVVTENAKRTVDQIYTATRIPHDLAVRSVLNVRYAKNDSDFSDLDGEVLRGNKNALFGAAVGEEEMDGGEAEGGRREDRSFTAAANNALDGTASTTFDDTSSNSGILVKTVLHASGRGAIFATILNQFPVMNAPTGNADADADASANASAADLLTAIDGASTRSARGTGDSFYFKPQFSKGQAGSCWEPLLPNGAAKQVQKQEKYITVAPLPVRDPKGEFANYTHKGGKTSEVFTSDTNQQQTSMDASSDSEVRFKWKPKLTVPLQPKGSVAVATDVTTAVKNSPSHTVSKATSGETEKVLTSKEEKTLNRDSFIASYVASSIQRGLTSVEIGASASASETKEEAVDVKNSSPQSSEKYHSASYDVSSLMTRSASGDPSSASSSEKLPVTSSSSSEKSSARVRKGSDSAGAGLSSSTTPTKGSTDFEDDDDEVHSGSAKYKDIDDEHGCVPIFIVRRKPSAPAATNTMASPETSTTAAEASTPRPSNNSASKWLAESAVSAAMSTALGLYTQSVSGFTEGEDQSQSGGASSRSTRAVDDDREGCGTANAARSNEADLTHERN